jgi:general secretion pathway protein A
MYESFYRLKERPFTLLPDPGFLYLSGKHRMALTLLEYGLMNQAGFTVISGDIGAGKTTLIRHVLDNMDREHTVGLITNTHESFGELLQWILLAFSLEHSGLNKVEMYQRFVDFIIDEYANNRRTVLIVDEAQNMAADTLEELRMLSNINADKDQALQVILVGQRELRETLRRPELVQFAQRIAVDYHLEPLSEAETAGYIQHRLKVAGGDPGTFTEAACRAIHRFSGGVPRLINLLCDTAMVYGFADQRRRIDAGLVTDVAREKQQGGIFPVFEQAPEESPVDPEAVGSEVAPEAGPTGGDEPAHEPEPEQEPVDIAQQTTSDGSGNAREEGSMPETAVEEDAWPGNARPGDNKPSEAELRWMQGAPKKKVRLTR